MEKAIRYSLLLSVVSSVVSVFLAGFFLAVALAAWLAHQLLTRRWRLLFPPYFPFVLAFMLAAGVAIAFSENPRESIRYAKKAIHFLAAAMVFTYFDGKLSKRALQLVVAAVSGSAILGIFQYFWQGKVELLGRATGLMSHWMTFAGQLMIVAVVLAAWLAGRTWPARNQGRRSGGWKLLLLEWPALLALSLILFTLVLTLTRSALLGCLAGLVVVLLARSYVLTGGLLVVATLAILVLPARFTDRLQSTLDPSDTTNRVRVELLRTGANAIRTHPWTGVGPRMISKVYPAYQVSREFPSWAYQHLHNNLVQIAAEMGLPALAAWLAIWLKIAWDHISFFRSAKTAGDRLLLSTGLGGLGALVAFLFAGLFEYNFGDSEILTLLLLVVTIPYICNRESANRIRDREENRFALL